MDTVLEKESQIFNPDVFEASSLALEPSLSNSGVMPELSDPVNLSLSRASSTPGFTGATYNLGTLPSYPPIQRNNYSVTQGDPTTVFKFRISDTCRINLNLYNITSGDDADLRLYQDSNGNGILDGNDLELASSTRGSNRDDFINYRSGADTYFAKVERYAPGSSGNVYYNLHLSATPTSGSSSQRASNLLPIETNIGTLNGTRTYRGWVGNTDTSDIFHFRLGSNRNVNLTLAGLSNDSDVRLIRDANGNRIIDSGDVLASSTYENNNSEWISRSLGAGNYFVQVHQYSGNTDYNLSVSTGDWYSQYLSDPGIIGLARHFAADGQLSRNEMIGILRDTKDYGSVSSTELRDLRTLVVGLPDAPRPVSMPGYVYNLSYKTVYDGNRANQWWTGGGSTRQSLGNLVAGASANHMEKLISKWFLGGDLPTASSNTTYRLASGSLFQGSISYRDIDQGSLGDCYFLASLAGTAFRSTSRIQNMFINNGDGTYTVRFYRNGVADYVTVNRELPFRTSTGRFYYANRDSGRLYNDVNNELWVALAEKAYAQINESEWVGQDNINRYQSPNEVLNTGIDGGTLAAISHITGLSNTGYIRFNTSELVRAYNANRITYLSDGGHAYTLVGYNSSRDRFSVYNPSGRVEFYNSTQMASKFVRFGYSGSRV